jgi:hypothetical protein
MTENLTTIWKEYRPDNVTKGSLVIDIGSSEGYFTDWARAQGARVRPFDARVNWAVGPHDGVCLVKGESTWAYIIPDEGDTPMVSLKTILAIYDHVDFLKCDIEGGEYFIFNCDISKVERLSIEFHAWTTPDKPIAGLGVRDEPMPPNAVEDLISFLEKTHVIEVVGQLKAGGYLHGVRK